MYTGGKKTQIRSMAVGKVDSLDPNHEITLGLRAPYNVDTAHMADCKRSEKCFHCGTRLGGSFQRRKYIGEPPCDASYS